MSVDYRGDRFNECRRWIFNCILENCLNNFYVHRYFTLILRFFGKLENEVIEVTE